jgi:hypothetical protein
LSNLSAAIRAKRAGPPWPCPEPISLDSYSWYLAPLDIHSL